MCRFATGCGRLWLSTTSCALYNFLTRYHPSFSPPPGQTYILIIHQYLLIFISSYFLMFFISTIRRIILHSIKRTCLRLNVNWYPVHVRKLFSERITVLSLDHQEPLRKIISYGSRVPYNANFLSVG